MQTELRKTPSVVLWRILGNDVVPRHAPGQTLCNIEFILEHEAEFPSCEKRFLLNRIMDEATVERIRHLLEHARLGYDVIPFVGEAYLEQRTADEKVRYITNVNAARNHCIKQGLAIAPIVLPFDGSCFFNPAGWGMFLKVAERNPDVAAFIVAMWRLQDNREALQVGRRPQLRETVGRRLWFWPKRVPVEPQLGFTRESDVLFDEGLVYSRCDKAEVLWRLGIPGPWDQWEKRLREQTTRRNGLSRHFGDRRAILNAGFVCRLSSGNQQADSSSSHRRDSRPTGLADLQKQADEKYGYAVRR
jgi:hypothetical protein